MAEDPILIPNEYRSLWRDAEVRHSDEKRSIVERLLAKAKKDLALAMAWTTPHRARAYGRERRHTRCATGVGSLRQHRHATRIARQAVQIVPRRTAYPRELMCIKVQDGPIMADSEEVERSTLYGSNGFS